MLKDLLANLNPTISHLYCIKRLSQKIHPLNMDKEKKPTIPINKSIMSLPFVETFILHSKLRLH